MLEPPKPAEYYNLELGYGLELYYEKGRLVLEVIDDCTGSCSGIQITPEKARKMKSLIDLYLYSLVEC